MDQSKVAVFAIWVLFCSTLYCGTHSNTVTMWMCTASNWFSDCESVQRERRVLVLWQSARWSVIFHWSLWHSGVKALDYQNYTHNLTLSCCGEPLHSAQRSNLSVLCLADLDSLLSPMLSAALKRQYGFFDLLAMFFSLFFRLPSRTALISCVSHIISIIHTSMIIIGL